MTDELTLMVHVPAEEWAFAKRRLLYLESVLAQFLRNRGDLREWYDAATLARLRLRGMPTSKAAITRKATEQGWLRRTVTARGGLRHQYHYSSFPERSFDDLISRILSVSAAHVDMPSSSPELPADPPPRAEAQPDNTEPPWVLPFMRLLKGGAKGDIRAAWRALPKCVPPGVVLPTAKEAAETILRLGLVK